MEDNELLGLLKNSPQKGLAAVVKQYSAYVYKIDSAEFAAERISRRLSAIFL